MEPLTGIQLAQNIRQRMNELRNVCEGVDEDTASRAPEGRWSPKEILSHLMGHEGESLLSTLQPFLDKETPTIDIEPENPFFSERRARMTFAQLLSEVETEYERVSKFAEGLSDAQLERRAHIPMLKDSPFEEYQTLGSWIGFLAGQKQSHVQFHIDHMREVLQGLDS